MKTEVLVEIDDSVIEAARALAIRRGISLAQLFGEALENLVRQGSGYDEAKKRAVARLKRGCDLGWVPPSSRDGLYDRHD